jgi:hypothetical protein
MMHIERLIVSRRRYIVPLYYSITSCILNPGQIHALHARTGIEVLLIATCSKTADFLRPYVVTTSDHPSQFFNLAIGHSVTDVAVRMEAYCISGAKGTFFLLLHHTLDRCADHISIIISSGVAQTYIQALLQLKSDTSALILNQLRKSSTIPFYNLMLTSNNRNYHTSTCPSHVLHEF